ncbi:BadF/BadG/BcrA/BcrD ATPase family protein [Cellulomonas sp. ES6]|uniref:N-acetylglucosamine kinase n=1 Tax=Cellulomonas sp. ES6 TaxID=3039384 RepID=UPI0024B77F41|nr:BadF/BadG/BcrA/BcrD ATPase family protein [Cellulomonas sp. ES6]WHP16212.1 BadF/BadG/BcrA/BcrD ATPase family protein [Cellulomonas sp. ES6]
MSHLVAGVDVGGTKTRVRVETADGHEVADATAPTTGWRGTSFEVKAELIAQRLSALAEPRTATGLAAVAVGAHGCDLEEESEELRSRLEERLPGVLCVVVNDAELVAPAAGSPEAVGLIAGTGSVAVGRTPDGRRVHAGGWGWVVGDEGGAAGIVREAVRASLRAVEDGRRDPLPEQLCRALAVEHPLDLPGRLVAQDPATWSTHAALVFDAAAAGSAVAEQLVVEAGEALADLVHRVVSRGARATRVVAAGGVVVSQPALRDALRAGLRARHLPLPVDLLDAPPVAGALALARTALDRTSLSPRKALR